MLILMLLKFNFRSLLKFYRVFRVVAIVFPILFGTALPVVELASLRLV